MRVLKFGGSSVGSPETVRNVIDIIGRKREEIAVLVVVSVFSGVTNLVGEAAGKASRGLEEYQQSIRELETRPVEASRELVRVQYQSETLTRFKMEFNKL